MQLTKLMVLAIAHVEAPNDVMQLTKLTELTLLPEVANELMQLTELTELTAADVEVETYPLQSTHRQR